MILPARSDGWAICVASITASRTVVEAIDSPSVRALVSEICSESQARAAGETGVLTWTSSSAMRPGYVAASGACGRPGAGAEPGTSCARRVTAILELGGGYPALGGPARRTGSLRGFRAIHRGPRT